MHSVQKAPIIIKSCTQKGSWKEVVKQLKQLLNGPPPETTAGKKEQKPYTPPIAICYRHINRKHSSHLLSNTVWLLLQNDLRNDFHHVQGTE